MSIARLDSLRAVVFDLDGLMFDSEALYHRVASALLAARGKEFTPEMMRTMLGRRAAEVTSVLREMAGLEESVEEILAETRSRFYALMDTEVRYMPGLEILLDHLRALGLPLAVATSSRRSYAERLLGGHGLLERFEFLLTSEDVMRGKPDPEIYLSAAARFGVAPVAMAVLEDSPPGIAAARAAGAFAIAVPHEHSPASGLAEAHLIVSRLDDPALLGLLPPLPHNDQR
ncbi:MAG TPA: HAD family phosphatase [Isosphaeraceae bacterium]|jgi:HAD superfamily hydrolase (TIGR01509 family)|nr:HAD family phosphatase [Isosphaeraceae bacterium]